MSFYEKISNQTDEYKTNLTTIYDKYKDKKLFQLLEDFRTLGICEEFVKSGLNFGDDAESFLSATEFLYELIEKDNIKYNESELQIWNNRETKEPYEVPPPMFALFEGGNSEEEIYDYCVSYVKEKIIPEHDIEEEILVRHGLEQ